MDRLGEEKHISRCCGLTPAQHQASTHLLTISRSPSPATAEQGREETEVNEGFMS